MKTLAELALDCYHISKEHGFWDNLSPFNVNDMLAKHMLIVSEVAEATEEARINPMSNKHDEELIDVLIRTLDLLGARAINVDNLLEEKMNKNRNRPRMHGKLA
jgi:NTP pyrophosphatase (non-canonical NTP hydrolase)